MKKLLTWVVGGAFLLSLQGAALAQKEEKAPAATPAVESQAPAGEVAKTEKKTTTKKSSKKAKTKKSKKKAKKAPEAPAE